MTEYAFISYSHDDKAYVDRLISHLTAAGITVWADDGLESGVRWAEMLEMKINDCDAFIVVVSRAAMKSEWVEREIAFAENRKKPLFPLQIESSVESIRLINKQYESISDGAMPHPRFAENIKRTLRRAAAAAAPQPEPAQVVVPALDHDELSDEDLVLRLVPRHIWADDELQPGEAALAEFGPNVVRMATVPIIAVFAVIIILCGLAALPGASRAGPTLFVTGGLAILVGLQRTAWALAQTATTRYRVTNKRVAIRTGLRQPTIQSVDLAGIARIRYAQGWLDDQFFATGALILDTAEGRTVTLGRIDSPWSRGKEILDACATHADNRLEGGVQLALGP